MAARARTAAAAAPRSGPVVIGQTVEEFSGSGQFDAVVCSLVLCSVRDPEGVLRHLMSLLRPGGQLRYLEHVASAGARGRLQRFADATVWPKFLGNCHTHRDTEHSIFDVGFEVDTSRREWTLPFWTIRPVVSELALGCARKPTGPSLTSVGRAAVAASPAVPGSPTRRMLSVALPTAGWVRD